MSKRKVISVLVAMVLVLSLFPTVILAAPGRDITHETEIEGDGNVVNNITNIVNFQLVFVGGDTNFRPQNLQFALWDLQQGREIDVLTVGGRDGHHKFNKARPERCDIRLKHAPAGFLDAYDMTIVRGANGVYIITCTQKNHVGPKNIEAKPIVVVNQTVVPLVPKAGF